MRFNRYNESMIHLHTRSCYSLLESSLQIEDIVRLAKSNGQKAAVLCDHRSMYGTMAFLRACAREEIQPVIGLELEVVYEQKSVGVLLLACTTRGLQDLFDLSTRLMAQEAVVSLDELGRWTKEAVVITSPGDPVLADLAYEKSEKLGEILKAFKGQAPVFYGAIALQDSPRFVASNQFFKALCLELEIPTAALSRIEYETDKDVQIVKLLQAIAQGRMVDDPSVRVRQGRFWRSVQEMEELYDKEDLDRTEEIVSLIEPYELPKADLPVFENRAGLPSEEYLRKLCLAGLKKRLHGQADGRYLERLEHELEIITSMGFADYFLIVWDFIREARTRQVLVGPGRGSAAGSLVAWCLGIAHVDPIANGLLFERFLNPSRISMPDIDTDFPDNRRDEIIEYVHQRYGHYHVAHIVTFARLKARLALRDSARALGLPMRQVEELTALIPNQLNVRLRQVYETNQAFASLVRSNRELTQLFNLACRIEGFPRHASIHAGGIVVAKESILAQAPLVNAGSDLPAVQFSMDELEALGLIKFDFLALRNLTLLDQMKERVEQITRKPLDLLKLPLDDPYVYQLLRKGDTLGLFQLESAGIRSLILRYRPECFADIAAILALYRPGPMKNIDHFLQARFDPKQRPSLHPLLDDLLKETGGIFVYQEQIMEAARLVGGFDLAQADSLRKAMSKKKREEMERWKNQFVQGAAQKGVSKEQAEHIFSIMEQFADYGFNKSHSYAYGLIVYQMAWIKAHFPLAFYESCLNGSAGAPSKVSAFLQEVAGRHIEIMPVSLNHSGLQFSMEGNRLFLPLTLVKGLSRQLAETIIEERKAHGPFADPALTIVRLLNLKLSAAQVQALIKAGAFEEEGQNRESLLASFDEISRLADLVLLDANTGNWYFAGVSAPLIQDVPVNSLQRLMDEYEVLGFYLSRHPAALYRHHNRRLYSCRRALQSQGLMEAVGILQGLHEFKTKKGQLMAFASLVDDTGQIDLAIMPWLYTQLQPVLKNGLFVHVRGKKNRPKSILVDALHLLDPAGQQR